MWGESAQRRPIPPRGPQGRLRMRVENAGRVCTTQTHTTAWPTRLSPNESGECGESLHNADPYHRVAHKAVSEREWRMQGGSTQCRPMPPRGPQGRLRFKI